MAWNQIFLALLLAAQAGTAVAQLPRSVDQSGAKADSLHLSGMALLARETDASRDSAVLLFHKAIAAELDFAPAYTGLSIAYNAMAPWDLGERRWVHLAIAFGEKAVFLAPGDPDAHMALADAYLSKRWYRQALQHYQRFWELRPTVDSAHFSPVDGASSLGWIWVEMGENATALEWLERAYALDSTDPAMLHYIGDTERVIGNVVRAERLLGRALAAHPDDRGVNASYLLLLLQQARTPEALAHGTALLARDADNPDFLTTAATAHWYAGNDSAAIVLFERAMAQSDGEDPYIEWWGTYASTALGHLYRRAGRIDESAAMLGRSEAGYRTRLHDAGEGWGYLYDLARVAAIRGDRDQALHWMRTAARFGFAEVYVAAVEPVMAGLREQPGFGELFEALEARMAQQRQR